MEPAEPTILSKLDAMGFTTETGKGEPTILSKLDAMGFTTETGKGEGGGSVGM